MLYAMGANIREDQLPELSAIQSWFDDRCIPCTIDQEQVFSPDFTLRGTVLGQRVYTDCKLLSPIEAKGIFYITFDKYFEGFDRTFVAHAVSLPTDRAFAFLLVAAIAELANGVIIDPEDPDDDEVDSVVDLCQQFIVESRLLLSLLNRDHGEKFQFVDIDALPPLSFEKKSSRKSDISKLVCEKILLPLDDNPDRKRRKKYRLSSSGLVLAQCMFRNYSMPGSKKHWDMIVLKESE